LISQLSYVNDFFKVRNLLDNEGIQMIPFKGFWLAHQAYGNLADRESIDVDVLINIRDLERIKNVMGNNGFHAENIFSGLTVGEIKRRFQEYNCDLIEGETSRFHIEFHWGICPPGYGMEISLDDLHTQIIRDKFQGREIDVFTPTAHLLLILMHHGGKDRFVQLKQVLDIALLVNKNPDIDWMWLIGEAKRYDVEPLIYVGVNLAATLTNSLIPREIRQYAESAKIETLAKNRIRTMMRPAYSLNNNVFHYDNWLFRMRTRNGLQTRLKITAASGRELTRKFFAGGSE
jgi:hypothetical protein